ncbi:MAG TPA: hypothetical protein VF823_08050 [Anaerolineales bacterium]
MSATAWHPIKVSYCTHAGTEVALEAELIYPADWLPDQEPRVHAHRCSRGLDCNLDGRSSCIWAGTNPAIDPFIEARDFRPE